MLAEGRIVSLGGSSRACWWRFMIELVLHEACIRVRTQTELSFQICRSRFATALPRPLEAMDDGAKGPTQHRCLRRVRTASSWLPLQDRGSWQRWCLGTSARFQAEACDDESSCSESKPPYCSCPWLSLACPDQRGAKLVSGLGLLPTTSHPISLSVIPPTLLLLPNRCDDANSSPASLIKRGFDLERHTPAGYCLISCS